jgi:Uncharacterized protein conserved in bacteria
MALVYHFDWDANKALGNQRKHGVSFQLATTVFKDPLALTIYDDEHSEDEERWVTLGLAGNGRYLVVVHTSVQTSAHGNQGADHFGAPRRPRRNSAITRTRRVSGR